MKERPSWPMKDWEVKAILENIKTQTRRVIKKKYDNTDIRWFKNKYGLRLVEMQNDAEPNRLVGYCELKCPYQVGDRLWLRETWAEPHYWTYDIDCEIPLYKTSDSKQPIKPVKWRSSICMPRWASRITLEIDEIQAEQLQDISENDAKAEGFKSKEEFISEFLKIYPNCSHESWVRVIKFHRIN